MGATADSYCTSRFTKHECILRHEISIKLQLTALSTSARLRLAKRRYLAHDPEACQRRPRPALLWRWGPSDRLKDLPANKGRITSRSRNASRERNPFQGNYETSSQKHGNNAYETGIIPRKLKMLGILRTLSNFKIY